MYAVFADKEEPRIKTFTRQDIAIDWQKYLAYIEIRATVINLDAVPELVAALELAVSALSDHWIGEPGQKDAAVISTARSALAKAKGGKTVTTCKLTKDDVSTSGSYDQ